MAVVADGDQYAVRRGLIFRGWRGKSAGKPCEINQIRDELVFRGAEEKCGGKPNEISAFGAELVFREIPGQLVQRGG
jgi:hypothetical protein